MNERNFIRDTFKAGKEQGLATTRNASDVIVSDDSHEYEWNRRYDAFAVSPIHRNCFLNIVWLRSPRDSK